MIQPKVSIIVPNYNHAQYLPIRIESIINQTYQNFELILMDDCSTDHSREIIEFYSSHPKISRVLFNEQNSGSPFKQWNKGVKEAVGEYIWIAESDDHADTRLLEVLVDKLDLYPDVGLAYCQSWNIDTEGQTLGTWLFHTIDLDEQLWKYDFIIEGRTLVEKYMVYKNVIPNASAVLFRKNAFINAGMADENIRVNGDWMVWVNILMLNKVGFVAEALNYFRSHTNNARNKNMQQASYLEEESRIIAYVKQKATVEPFFLERALSKFINRWSKVWFVKDIPLKRHVAVYKNLRTTDEILNQRILRKLFKEARKLINN